MALKTEVQLEGWTRNAHSIHSTLASKAGGGECPFNSEASTRCEMLLWFMNATTTEYELTLAFGDRGRYSKYQGTCTVRSCMHFSTVANSITRADGSETWAVFTVFSLLSPLFGYVLGVTWWHPILLYIDRCLRTSSDTIAFEVRWSIKSRRF